MLIQLKTHRAYFDLLGADDAPVVCFTHSLAADSGMWAEQVPPLLANGLRVLRIDMRGHGGSSPAPGDYTMEDLAGDVSNVISALNIGAVHYVGLSIGGMFGQAFALQHAPQLKSIMICDALPASPENAQALWAPRVEAVRKTRSLSTIADGTIERWLTASYKAKYPKRWQQVYDTILGTTADGFLGCAAAIQNFDFVPNLGRVSTPTMVLCGADDTGTPLAQNERIAQLIPHAHFQKISGAMHFPNVEAPDAFNTALIDWLKVHR